MRILGEALESAAVDEGFGGPPIKSAVDGAGAIAVEVEVAVDVEVGVCVDDGIRSVLSRKIAFLRTDIEGSKVL